MRRILRPLVTLAVIAALLLGAAGWYYSGEIHADAFAIEHEHPLNVTIAQVEGSREDLVVTLRSEDPPPQFAARGAYGLSWNGGYGRLGEVVATRGNVVERRAEVVSGEAPDRGERARLESYAFSHPGDAGLTQDLREVAIPSQVGDLPAWLFGEPSGRWLIFMHGRNAERREGLRIARAARAAGYTVLIPAYRNDAGAPESVEGRTLHGATEWADLDAAVEHAEHDGARRIVLGGASMGGAIVMSFLANSDREDAITGVVLDAPMLDLVRTIEFGASQRELPLLGEGLPGILTDTATAIAAWRYDLDWDAMGYLDEARHLQVPALVFHGTADPTVPVSTSRELARINDNVELVEVEGAVHVGSWNRDPAAYERRVRTFLESL